MSHLHIHKHVIMECARSRTDYSDFFALFHGREEVPVVENMIEKIVAELKVELSATELTIVRYLAITKSCKGFCSVEEGYKGCNFTENDREDIIDIIMHVKTTHYETNPVPKYFRDYHEFGIESESEEEFEEVSSKTGK